VSSAEFTRTIRAAAGQQPTTEPEPVGSVGIGLGGSAVPRQPPSPSMTALIRASREMQRREWFALAEEFDRG
jgi:hypothetical protein